MRHIYEGGIMAEVSVIIPVYNTETYLGRCLDSVLGQSLEDIEIICVDDGSTDKSPLILDAYAAKDARVKVIHKENAGLVSARKTGLMAADGKYIGFVDSDDWIEPDMYEWLHRAALEYDADVVMMRGRYEEAEGIGRRVYQGIPEGYYDKEELLQKVYPGMIVNGAFFEWGIFPGMCDKLFKRECHEPYQMAVDERLTMGEDAACVYPCLLNADSIRILPDCLYHYRQSMGSMVRKKEDTELARMRFRVLYHSVMESFERYKSIYDLREQWRDYLLFLMVPRADVLYRGIEELDYLFPFPEVKKGSDIIIYGMGTYGQRLYRFVKASNICHVVAAADRNAEALRKQGFPVIAPDEIGHYQCDAIVIAGSFAGVRDSIYRDLRDRYPDRKIYGMDEGLIKSEETLRKFGLL